MMGMKSCLAVLLLVIALGGLIITVAYHVSVNSELRFETRDSHEEYINTRRSYRPPKNRLPHQAAPVAKPEFADEEVAEEVPEEVEP